MQPVDWVAPAGAEGPKPDDISKIWTAFGSLKALSL